MIDLPPVTPSVEISVATDGIYQGVTQTGGEYQVVGKARLTAGKVYVEGSAKNVELDTGADAELAVAAGVTANAFGLSFDSAVIYRNYQGTRPGLAQDQFEIQSSAARDFGPVSAKVTYTFSPDVYGPAEQSHFVEAAAAFDVVDGTRISAAVGRRDQVDGQDYTVWNVGLTQRLTDRISADVRYYDSEVVDRFNDADDARIVGAIRAKF